MRVDLDGRYAFSLEPEVAMHLKEGQCLSEDELETLLRANERERAQAAALRALGHRPYSRQEMAQKLARKHFDEDTTAQVLANLTARGLLDDAEFARFWRDNRDAFRPRSRALVGLELRRKGVAVDAVNSATADMDDEASALQAGEKKAKTLKGADYDTFYRRLGDYLKRRGYNYEVIKVTINKLWQAQM
ncbi:MAG: RecX family transcriptional regulator [Dehalococcoidia bacterium]|nr:RecX family transcriptional regulator [Dehalococcoidia bacterium]